MKTQHLIDLIYQFMKNRILTFLLILCMAVSCLAPFSSVNTYADIMDQAGSCYWMIDPEGALIIAPADNNEGYLEADSLYHLWPWSDYSDIITSVSVYGHVIAPQDSSKMFAQLYNCTSMDLKGLDMSGVTDTSYMFYFCSSLNALDLSSFYAPHVTDMKGMFEGCSELKDLDVSAFSTSFVTDMSDMFDGCSSLTELDLTSFNTSSVRTMSFMFAGCTSLAELNLVSFITDNVTDMSYMFSGCESLLSADVTGFSTMNVTDMAGMFSGCESLTELDLSDFDTRSAANMNSMFSGCSYLGSIYASEKWSLSGLYSSYLSDPSGNMFEGCASLCGGYYSYDPEYTDSSMAAYEYGYFTYRSADAAIIRLSRTRSELPVYSTLKLNTYVRTENYYTPDITWSSSDESVAVVDENGLVTAVSYGEAVITAYCEYDDSVIPGTCVIKTRFADVAGSPVKGDPDYQYYYEPIYWAADNGITKGYNGEYFSPLADCTRKDMLIFMWKHAGSPYTGIDARDLFTDLYDLPAGTTANKAIAWAYSEGITKGFSDGTFRPEDTIVRKDTLIMLYRMAGKPYVSGSVEFPDILEAGYPETSDTYKAILWAVKLGIAAGYPDGTFGPFINCQRSHIITFLYRYALSEDTKADSALVEVARSQLELVNYGGEPYWSWFGFSYRVEWCGCFAAWCADECGYIKYGLFLRSADPMAQANFFMDTDRWYSKYITPDPGMFIYFDWDGIDYASHVGIVERVEDGYIYTIEGNASDHVKQNVYPVGDSRILGYGSVE